MDVMEGWNWLIDVLTNSSMTRPLGKISNQAMFTSHINTQTYTHTHTHTHTHDSPIIDPFFFPVWSFLFWPTVPSLLPSSFHLTKHTHIHTHPSPPPPLLSFILC